MRITADTNLLVRAALKDDEAQAASAMRLLGGAALVAIPVAIFCELAWVLRQSYRRSAQDTGRVIEGYLNVESVATDRPAVEAGLVTLRLGGDFADGAVALQGRAAGGEIFASFDRKAVGLLRRLGYEATSP